jgi:hypothetical protein
MPFNEKGEFVRAYQSIPHNNQHRDLSRHSMDAGQSPASSSPQNNQDSDQWEAAIGCLIAAIGIPIALWLAWTFRGFVLIGLALWALKSLRSKA